MALAVFASAFASEFSQGTLRNLLVREPRRPALLAGKYAAMASAATGAVVLAPQASCPFGLGSGPPRRTAARADRARERGRADGG